MRIKTGLLLLILTNLIVNQAQAKTIKLQQITGKIFADNSFTLFVNGKKVASDPIKYLPYNTVKVKFNTTYPIVYAIEAKDYAHPETGLEQGHTKIGTGGFIVKFSDGTVTHSQWKCKTVSKGPTNKACVNNLPWLNCMVKNIAIPKNWMAVDFDDRNWNNAYEYFDTEIHPQGDFAKNNWKGAKFIWTKDLEIDNTILCRLKVEKPKTPQKIVTIKTKKIAKVNTKIEKKVIKKNTVCKEKSRPFLKFSKHVKTHCDDNYLYIESDGMADHSMMIGISAWNQQVPKPQYYMEKNAWKIPLYPVASHNITPLPINTAIAIAINGVPIFNPSEKDNPDDKAHDPNIIGQLDICGGHAGYDDNYHYHLGSKCLIESIEDASLPIAYALDGYPIYPYTNKSPTILDECHGAKTKEGHYQYYATETFPYINACFKGEVDLKHLPRTDNLRMSGLPIRTNIYEYQQLGKNRYQLSYRYQGKNIQINYRKYDKDCYLFQFSDGNRREIYCANNSQVEIEKPSIKKVFTEKTQISYIVKAAQTLGISAQRLRDSMGKPPYDYKKIAAKLRINEGLLYDALGIKRPHFLRKKRDEKDKTPAISYIVKAAQTLGISEQKLRNSMGKPPYDYKKISKRLKVDERLLYDALGIKSPYYLRKKKKR